MDPLCKWDHSNAVCLRDSSQNAPKHWFDRMDGCRDEYNLCKVLSHNKTHYEMFMDLSRAQNIMSDDESGQGIFMIPSGYYCHFEQ